jgi:DNA-binding XRE family transcriptional regulator
MSIKQSRKNLGITQAKLAPLLGLPLKTLQNYEQGCRPTPKPVLILLSKIIDDFDKEES